MPDQIDYGVVLEWLKTCQDLHPDCRVQNRACNLPGFKVIDCTTNTVVVAPERCSYVALSYVWGAAPAQMGSGWPLVISDRILVALSLGLHYLWVDRYCIDQEETPEKQAQISQMDRIYNDSQITIVAAAGDGPQYGLPGVSARSRKQQQALEIDGITLAQVFHRTPRALEAATWTTRGWTYQEGFLSRRRLIFTDHQVSFVCNTMYCAES
ncbi:HET-domain-containing protein, partial [Polyplosphaeria fusca]